MRLGDALNAIMCARTERAAWREYDLACERLHEDDIKRLRKEFNRIAGERRWAGRAKNNGKGDTRNDAWRNDTAPVAVREAGTEFLRTKRMQVLDEQIVALRVQVAARLGDYEWI